MKLKVLAGSLLLLITATDVMANRHHHRREANREAARAERRARAGASNHRNPGRVHRSHRAPSVNRHHHTPSRGTINRGTVRRHVHTPAPSRHTLRERNRLRSGYYGTPRYHRPPNYRSIPYRRYYHNPIRRIVRHNINYTPINYYRRLRNVAAGAFYVNWILRSSTRSNGYFVINNYPYFVHNGYRHRYSSVDTCNYQLFDKYTHQVVGTYWNQICSYGYNQCALDRDARNERAWSNRYECAETFRNSNYDFNTPSHNNNSSCYDYDWETGICYDNY